MVFDPSKINGLGPFTVQKDSAKHRELYLKGDHAFLIINPHTIEVRCDKQLSETLQEEYESVMESRYFGRGGIEIVLANQLAEQEIEDLIRLSYNLTNPSELS